MCNVYKTNFYVKALKNQCLSLLKHPIYYFKLVNSSLKHVWQYSLVISMNLIFCTLNINNSLSLQILFINKNIGIFLQITKYGRNLLVVIEQHRIL